MSDPVGSDDAAMRSSAAEVRVLDANSTESTPTHPSRTENVGEGDGEALPVRAGKRRGPGFTSESAREARRVRALKDAQRKSEAAEEAKLAHLTSRQRMGIALSELTIDDMRAVRDALLVKAKAGDEKAVNAIARLLDQSYGRAGQEEAVDPTPRDERPFEQWTAGEKAEYRAALLQERDRQRVAAGQAADPRFDQDPTEGTDPSTPSRPQGGEGEAEEA